LIREKKTPPPLRGNRGERGALSRKREGLCTGRCNSGIKKIEPKGGETRAANACNRHERTRIGVRKLEKWRERRNLSQQGGGTYVSNAGKRKKN